MERDAIEIPAPLCARTAGGLYLVIIAAGLSGELLIRARLIVPGDASATVANLLASPALYRSGFAADALMLLCDVAVAVLLYRLFKPVNATLSLMAAAFRLTQAAILGANLLHYYAPLLLLSAPADSFHNAQLHGLVALFLELHRHGYDLGLIFFGLSNIILGYLLIRSRSFPSLLGYGLLSAGVVYLAGSFVRFLAPSLSASLEPAYLIPLAAELSFALWLLARGGDISKQHA